jgi:DNA polymerase III delta subunit
MLYYFYGDLQKANIKAKELVQKMLDKKPDAELFLIDNENVSENLLQEMTQSVGLFQNKYIVRIKQIDTKEKKELILNFLKEIKESENIFVWGDGEVNKTDLKRIEKSSEKIVGVNSKSPLDKLGTSKSKNRNKIFEICNFLVSRNKKDAWTKYQELLKDFAVEELHGTIFWQFKNIVIAYKSSVKDSGLAPYPYQTAKSAQSKYTEKEALDKLNELTKILHKSRSTGESLEIMLEKFLLSL